MFRSVFTKLISVFVLILLLSFLLLSSILGAMVNNYNLSVKMNTMSGAAKSVSGYLIFDYGTKGATDFSQYLHDNVENIVPVINLLAVNAEHLRLCVIDDTGKAVCYGGVGNTEWESQDSLQGIPDSVLASLEENGFVSDDGDLDGFFTAEHCTYGIAIRSTEGEFLGAVIASTVRAGMGELLTSMNKTVLMSTLWVMLAALVAVYFMTERMVSPLKSMSQAARLFAEGKFDARVPVIGSDEIAELAMAFNHMAESLSAIDETQRSFIANVSHDLRTPMTTISGFIDGILSGAIPPEKQEYYLGVISTEVRRLSRLVSALLDISRMQAGERKFTMAGFDICELARQILISFEQKIDGKKLDVCFQCDSEHMEVCADRDAIHQVLYNICDNAIKFAYEGGRYEIHITEWEKKIRVSVYNEGIGIPETDITHIFDRFYKSDKSRGLDKSGAGLGMYISRTIIEAHGERIWAESQYEKWCRFTFTLPKVTGRDKGKTAERSGENQEKETV